VFRETPEITRSVGTPKSVVVLWPRMSAKSVNPQTKDLAQRLQARVRDLAAQAAPGRGIDLRPDPERSCPRPNGCDAPTVSVLFLADNGACAALVVVSKPGPSPQQLVPWIGQVRLKRDAVPFREPTESAVTVDDFASCAKMSESFGDHEADIVAAIKTVLP
jgi:hypothetical protein